MVVLQITFDYTGGYGDKMYEECKDLAQSINNEKGFLWKIWTENNKNKIAGGIYAFDQAKNAENYANMHIQRLENLVLQKTSNMKY